MSNSVVLASVTASNAAIASGNAHQARVERCKIEIMQFESKTATVKQMQSYAKCVDTVYPDDLSPSDIIVLKGLFVIALIGAVIGIWRSVTYRDDLSLCICAGAFGFVLAPAILIACIALISGIKWLFN